MTSLASSAGSLHKDIRSESRGFKRDKDSSAKWAIGARPATGVVRTLFDPDVINNLGDPKTWNKIRPEKKNSESSSYRKFHSNTERGGSQGMASNRVARKADAKAEVSSPNQLSRSLAELAPHNSPTKTARTPSMGTDAGVLYSFDAVKSPGNGVGLDSLVEKAEREWSNRETAKLVKNEYEILGADEKGEITVVKEGKKGRRSPKSRPQLVVDDDEDDWERI